VAGLAAFSLPAISAGLPAAFFLRTCFVSATFFLADFFFTTGLRSMALASYQLFPD
jgi:hypothetical protein